MRLFLSFSNTVWRSETQNEELVTFVFAKLFWKAFKGHSQNDKYIFCLLKEKSCTWGKKVEKSKNAFRVFSLDKYDHNKEIRYETFWKVLLRFPKLCLFLLGFQLKIKKKRKIFGIANFLWNSKKGCKMRKSDFQPLHVVWTLPKIFYYFGLSVSGNTVWPQAVV